MTDEPFQYRFSALRGIQGGREYYVAMCPLRLLSKIFLFDEEEVAPEIRAQRTLNRARLPEITRYIVDNPRDYVFSSLTASIDGRVEFLPHVDHGSIGSLVVPMSARFVIADGQHRRAAIEEALKEKPELGEETISVVFFLDAGLKRSQQLFSDLNRHAVRPTQSIGLLYDHRDPLAGLARGLATDHPVFRGLTEMEKTSISNRSRKLFTLSSIYHATRKFLGKARRASVTEREAALAREFWSEVGKHMGDWQAAQRREVSTKELRQDTIHAHGIGLQAIAIAGAALLQQEPRKWKSGLRGLEKIDWARSNASVWEGRATVGGKLNKTEANVQLTANVIKKALGVPLTEQDSKAEARRSHARAAK
ncbi:MAG: DNA sulfur modification protein DndB [Myxococcales bacterium]